MSQLAITPEVEAKLARLAAEMRELTLRYPPVRMVRSHKYRAAVPTEGEVTFVSLEMSDDAVRRRMEAASTMTILKARTASC